MDAFSPSAEWYEPLDLIEDDEPEPTADEILTVAGGLVWWSAPIDTAA